MQVKTLTLDRADGQKLSELLSKIISDGGVEHGANIFLIVNFSQQNDPPFPPYSGDERVVIDRERMEVTVDGRAVALQPRTFKVLAILANRPKKVFSRDELLNLAWGGQVVVDRCVDVQIRKLRDFFGEDCIQTVRGVGYKFVPQPAKN